MDNPAQPQSDLDTRALQHEIEKTISDLTEFRGSLKVRLGIIDDRIIQFTDTLKLLKPKGFDGAGKKPELVGVVGVARQKTNNLKSLLMNLGCDHRWVEISAESLAARLDVSETRANEFIKVLKTDHGLQVINPRHKGCFNLYRFCSPELRSEKLIQINAEKAALAPPKIQTETNAQKLDAWLRQAGADDQWISFLHADIAEHLSCSLVSIGNAFRSLEHKGLRAFAGKPKHYTYNADLPDPYIVIRGKTGVIKKTITERRAVELDSYLQKLGADKAWISLTFTNISKSLGWPLNSVRPAIEYLIEHHGLKFHVGRLKTPSRFTFSKFEKDENPPEPKPAIKRVAVKSRPAIQRPNFLDVAAAQKSKMEASGTEEIEDALLEKLHEIKVKIGMDSFSIPVKNLVLHVGYPSAQIIAAMAALVANGEIEMIRFNQPAQEYFLKISEAE